MAERASNPLEAGDYTGGDALLDALIALGAKRAFGVPGESYLAALDAVARRGADFEFISCRHEAGAANMAEAAGKMTGTPGICFVTRGPGATHASIGLHTAFQDSTPMLIVIGQVARDQRDREAFQEIDYTKFLSEVTKLTLQIDDPARIGEYVIRAMRTAVAGRPGPVAIAVPEDVLSGPAPRRQVQAFRPAVPYAEPASVEAAVRALAGAKRPMIMVGGSGWNRAATATLAAFAGRHHIPVMASFRAQDRLDNDHPAYAGDMGIGANPALVKRMDEADLLLVLGARLGEMTTAGYSRIKPEGFTQSLIHIHQGAEEIGRVYQPDIGIVSAPGAFLDQINSIAFETNPAWQAWCAAARADYETWQEPTQNAGPVQIAEIYQHLNARLPADTIYANGAGAYSLWLHRFARYRSFPSQIAPTSGAMGYGMGAAIGAKLTAPERTVVSVAGDGCGLMGITEIATAVQYGAGVLYLVFNNGLYGSIRLHQARAYPGRVSATELNNPDFAALARSFGAYGAQVSDDAAFRTLLEEALAATAEGRPALLEIPVESDVITPTTTLSAIEKSTTSQSR